ncbi:MAG: tetratricopeptide repeat protein [Verrucomicrobiota bacterium]
MKRILLLLLALCPGFLGAQDSVIRSLFQDPAFQKRLAYSFAINTEIEPVIQSAELQQDYTALAQMAGSDPARAAGLLKQIVADESASAQFNTLLGNIYFQADKKKEAAAQFLIAIKKFPNFLRAHQSLAVIYLQANRPEQAKEHFTRVVELGGASGDIYGLLGAVYTQLEDWVAAETAFRNAVMLLPRQKQWKLGLVQALFAQQRFQEAANLLQPLIENHPDEEQYWTLQATAYLGQQEYLKAAGNYEILAGLGKATPEMLTTLADIYVNEDLNSLAAETYVRAYESSPGTGVETSLRAAEILMQKKALPEAHTLLSKAQSTAGDALATEDKVRLLKLEAKVAFAEDPQSVEGREKLEQVVNVYDPLDGDAFILLGQYYERTPDAEGKPQNELAMEMYKDAAEDEEMLPLANFRHAQLIQRIYPKDLSRIREAITLLKAAQSMKESDKVGDYLEDLERYAKSLGS